MKSLIAFSHEILQEMGGWCHTSTSRDCKTVAARIEHEGSSFLTITLADFGHSFERALDLGLITRSDFTSFRWNQGLPVFLQGFLELVFDRGSGLLLDVPSVDAIRCIRQFTLMFAKIELPCSKEREDAALARYIKCEQDLRAFPYHPDNNLDGDFKRVGMLLWRDLFAIVDKQVYDGDLLPKHGPGKTADRLRGNAKFQQLEWTARLEQWFPYGDYCLPSWRHNYAVTPKFLEPGTERPVKVTLVPKTLKTPRIIAQEPTCMQYMQQAIFERLQESIRADDIARWLICSDSQTPNRDMARKGSSDGSLATLDLSDASDRVSNQHVRSLLTHFPSLAGGVDACRSRKADVPGHGIIPLAKFASMGSALCFPMEAIVFATIVFIGIERVLGRPLTRGDIHSFRGKVRVYGDDILVPVEFVDSVIETLTIHGMKVNSNKSFWTGRFRESCGGDYYDGTDVSLTRIRRTFPTTLEHVEEMISTISLRNQLYEAGFRSAVAWIDTLVTGILPRFPFVPRSSPVLGRWTDSGDITIDGVHRDYHTPFVRGYVVSSRLPVSNLDGLGALTKFFLKRGVKPYDKNHLHRAGRPSSVDIKMRCVSTG